MNFEQLIDYPSKRKSIVKYFVYSTKYKWENITKKNLTKILNKKILISCMPTLLNVILTAPRRKIYNEYVET